ncbi:MAG: helix-turn-helix domain-containing protein [Thermoplasmata archaeon]
MTLFEIHFRSPEGEDWIPELRTLPSVRQVEPLYTLGSTQVCRVYFVGRTLVPVLRNFGLVRQFPFPIQDGVAHWTVIGPATKVRALCAHLSREVRGVEIESVISDPTLRPATLTPHQKEVLRTAMEEGYFDVPRRITLGGLAAKLDLAASTLSVALAVIERKIVEVHR